MNVKNIDIYLSNNLPNVEGFLVLCTKFTLPSCRGELLECHSNHEPKSLENYGVFDHTALNYTWNNFQYDKKSFPDKQNG